MCDENCNVTSCAFDRGDCKEYRPSRSSFKKKGCPCPSELLSDGFCDNACNSSACSYDGGDCLALVYCPVAMCNASILGDGKCDAECNVYDCGYDAGDCSVESVEDDHGHLFAGDVGLLITYTILFHLFPALVLDQRNKSRFQELAHYQDISTLRKMYENEENLKTGGGLDYYFSTRTINLFTLMKDLKTAQTFLLNHEKTTKSKEPGPAPAVPKCCEGAATRLATSPKIVLFVLCGMQLFDFVTDCWTAY